MLPSAPDMDNMIYLQIKYPLYLWDFIINTFQQQIKMVNVPLTKHFHNYLLLDQ